MTNQYFSGISNEITEINNGDNNCDNYEGNSDSGSSVSNDGSGYDVETSIFSSTSDDEEDETNELEV